MGRFELSRVKADYFYLLKGLLEHACPIDLHSSNRVNYHLMIFVTNIHTQRFELTNKLLDLLLCRVSALVSKIFVGGSAHDFVHGPCQAIGDAHFGFVC